MAETRKLAAILAADVVGYSRLVGSDEERTLARLRALWSDLIAPTIAVHDGRVVKRTGDGSIIEFRSVVDAMRCAIEMQNGMVERNAGLPHGRAEETERDENEALRLSPRDKNAWAWMHFSGSAKLYLGENKEAVAWFRRGIELRRDFPLTHFWLAAALANLGRLEEARTEAHVGRALDPTFTIRRFLERVESDNPVFLKQRAQHADAMRKAGIPEE
jgi:tetratricopeptide (TPR) repeat protein